MTAREAIVYLEAILEDTLDPNDESDAKRIEAVELAIAALKKELDRPGDSPGIVRGDPR